MFQRWRLGPAFARRNSDLGVQSDTVLTAAFAALIADEGASIKHIEHERTFMEGDLSTVTVRCVVETRDAGHIRELRERLARDGYSALFTESGPATGHAN